MARQRLQLIDHLSPAELKKLYRACKDAKEARRWHVIWLVSQGHSVIEASRTVGLGPSWVREVIHRYNEKGPASVKDLHHTNPGGKKPRLDSKQQEELIEALKQPHPHGGVWTGPRVAEWIQQRTGIETYPQLGWVYLRTLGPKLKLMKQFRVRTAGNSDG